jgi:hypothetical protein
MQKLMLAVATTALLSIASATDPPEVKEGLWSVQTATTSSPSGKKTEGSYTICRDHAYDQYVRTNEKNMKRCTTVSENFQDGVYTSEIRCKIGSGNVASKGTTTYKDDTSVHSESHVTYDPPLGGVSESTIVIDQKFSGKCPEGTVPGDRTNPDGTVIHLGKD